MDTALPWALVAASGACGLWRLRGALRDSGADAFASPSAALGFTFVLLTFAWGYYLYGEPANLDSSILLAVTACSVALSPESTRDEGCKYTPLCAGACFLVRGLVAELVTVYVTIASVLFCAAALWVAAPRVEVQLCESAGFLEPALRESVWPQFIIVEETQIKVTSGGVESKNNLVQVDEALDNGTIQVRTKIGDPYRVVKELRRQYMRGMLQ